MRQAVVTATAAATIVVTPSYLLGAVGFLVRDEMGFSEAALGGAVAAFFVASMTMAVLGGFLSDRLGAGRSLQIAVLVSGIALLGLGFSASLVQIVLFLLLGGAAHGLAQPATNLAIVRGVPDRQGFAFGIKQAAIPGSTLLAGAAVPLVALTAGWRWSFFGAAVLAAVVLVMVAGMRTERSGSRRGQKMREGDAATAPLLLFTVAIGFAIVAATGLGTFTVESAVSRGVSPSAAGGILATGSLAGIAVRLLAGLQSDRHQGRHLVAVAVMMALGAGGYLLLAVGQGFALVLAGTLVAYGFGWGWNGLAMYAVVRLNTNAPGAASGIALFGASAGAALGPVGFGIIVARGSYALAWTACSLMALIAAALMVVARQWLLIDRKRRLEVTGGR